MKRVLLLDNYDSFTYNLKHYISNLGFEVEVIRNDVFDIDVCKYSHVVLSPGPGLPNDAGSMMQLIERVDSKTPLLGVCLGMQAIAEYLDGSLYNQAEVKHGVAERIRLDDVPLFQGLLSEIEVGLYHSWSVNDVGGFDVVARSKSGVVMAIQNADRQMYGVQFHPESIMTQSGIDFLGNFLRM